MDKKLLDELQKNHDRICLAHNNRINGLKKSNVTCFLLIIITICIIIFKVAFFDAFTPQGQLSTIKESVIELIRKPLFMPLAVLSIMRIFFYFGIMYYHSKLTQQHQAYEQILISWGLEKDNRNDTSTNNETEVIPLSATANPSFFKRIRVAIMTWLATF